MATPIEKSKKTIENNPAARHALLSKAEAACRRYHESIAAVPVKPVRPDEEDPLEILKENLMLLNQLFIKQPNVRGILDTWVFMNVGDC